MERGKRRAVIVTDVAGLVLVVIAGVGRSDVAVVVLRVAGKPGGTGSGRSGH